MSKKTLFPKRLHALRRQARLTQAKLAGQLNYSTSAIANYESGRNEPCLHDIIRLARIFDVSVDYLIGNADINLKQPMELNSEDCKILILFHSLDKTIKDVIISFVAYLSDLEKQEDIKVKKYCTNISE